MFSEYATAVEGMLQSVLVCIGKLLLAPPTKLGAPNGAGNPNTARVSITRHGVIATNINVLGAALAVVAVAIFADDERSATEGCQYSGADQYFSGATSRISWAASVNGTVNRDNASRRFKRNGISSLNANKLRHYELQL